MASSAKASAPKSKPPAASAPREATVKSTPARKTTVPPKAKSTARSDGAGGSVTREMIAERAYHLWRSGAPGGELDHWCCAERELNGGK